mmetsp:Transcript_107165/g.169301  ORF Transcript_107165/g.169301 Transcript_107165/m.169301 type:complete len:159 (+) Transcript_107165:65-541(+)|eukprot:CAMPEP_0169137672 /NCGR_PEP_ID=MMETSP1015-20121227/41683_1 /TAXON_ID=342587 /ORGANISM="Karlodinium micrum, Strain CCMP2283" /LENGTH=158 /DNA_ID=CAMNT_0009202571 /DNA_START=46 /DNA_END=522 /DNA_ORIENTATION=+
MSADEEVGGADIFYIAEAKLKELKQKIADKGEITADDVAMLTNPATEDADGEAMMIPVDMRGIDGDFEDVDAMIEKLGAKATVEGFVKAREYFEANKDGEPEEDRPQPMTAAEWESLLAGDGEGEEEEFMEGEEEELFMEGEEEEGADEPPEKKAKTD